MWLCLVVFWFGLIMISGLFAWLTLVGAYQNCHAFCNKSEWVCLFELLQKLSHYHKTFEEKSLSLCSVLTGIDKVRFGGVFDQ